MSTLRVKYGVIEVEYEGEVEFDKAEVFDMLESMSKFGPLAPTPLQNNGASKLGGNGDTVGALTSVGSVSEIAQRLGVSTGPEMVMAAAAALHFLSKKIEFTTRDLTATMREAKGFFSKSYASNVGSLATSLVKSGKLRSPGGDRYSLSATSIQELESRLA